MKTRRKYLKPCVFSCFKNFNFLLKIINFQLVFSKTFILHNLTFLKNDNFLKLKKNYAVVTCRSKKATAK